MASTCLSVIPLYLHLSIYTGDARVQGQTGEGCNFTCPNQVNQSLLGRALKHVSDTPILKVTVLQKSDPSATFFPFCILCLHFGYFLIHEWFSCTMHHSMETKCDHFFAYSFSLSLAFSVILKLLSGKKGRKMLFGDLEYPVCHKA